MDLDLFMSYVLCGEAACDTKGLNFVSQKVTSRYMKFSSDYQEHKKNHVGNCAKIFSFVYLMFQYI